MPSDFVSKLVNKFTKKEKDNSRYVIWVTSFDGEGYSSMYYGWSTNKTFSHDEAIKKAEALKDKYYSVEIISLDDFIVGR